MPTAFYDSLVEQPDEPPWYMDDNAYAKWKEWYGNGQIKQVMGNQKIRCVPPCAPSVISQDASHKVYRVTLMIVDASGKQVGQSYTRDISLVKDAQGYWWVDSFDPIRSS